MNRSIFFALVLLGCPPSPVSPIPDGDGATGPANAAMACARAEKLGCPEGKEPTCEKAWTKAATIREVDFSCITSASDASTLRTCSHGFVPCAGQ